MSTSIFSLTGVREEKNKNHAGKLRIHLFVRKKNNKDKRKRILVNIENIKCTAYTCIHIYIFIVN